MQNMSFYFFDLLLVGVASIEIVSIIVGTKRVLWLKIAVSSKHRTVSQTM